MYSREEYEELQSLRYVHHTIEPVVYTLDKKHRVLCETIETKVRYLPERYLPDKWGWAQREPTRKVWCIVSHAGYFPIRDEQQRTIIVATIEEALDVIRSQQ